MPDSLPPPPWGPQPLDDRDLDALLAGNIADLPVALRPVADALAALHAPPARAELRGEAAIRAEFRALAGFRALRPGDPAGLGPRTANGAAQTLVRPPLAEGRPRRRHRRRKPAGHPATGRFGVVLAAAAAVVILAAFAYSGSLPGPVQRLAHITLAAPAARHVDGRHAGTPDTKPGPAATHSSTAASSPDSPAASASAGASPRESASPSAASLCEAVLVYPEHAVGGEGWWDTQAGKELIKAAGGLSNVRAYCGRAWRGHPHKLPQIPSSLGGYGAPGAGAGSATPTPAASDPAGSSSAPASQTAP